MDDKPNSQLKVLFVTVQFEHVNSGPGTFANYIFSSFTDRSDIDIHIVTEDVDDSKTYEGKVSKVPLPRFGLLKNRLIRGWYYRHTVQSLEKHNDFDVIWFNTSPLIAMYYVLMRRSSNPTALMLSDDNNISMHSRKLKDAGSVTSAFKKKIFSYFERAALRHSDMVVANSNYLKDTIIHIYHIPEDRIRILYKAVDLSLFSYREPELPFPQSTPLRVLFVKRDYRRGGLATVLDGLSRLDRNIELSIAGPTEKDYPAIQEMASKSSFEGDMHFLGRLTKGKLARVYHEHDLLCILSTQEALGVVFLEAMSSGIAVIGSRVGGIPEVLRDGECGWIIEPNNPEALARTIDYILRHEDDVITKLRSARASCNYFSVERMIEDFESILRDMLPRERSTRS